MAFIPLAAAGVSALGGFLASQGNKPRETKIQRRQRRTIDDIIASLKGNGPYSDLFSHDDELFNRTFVKPAQDRFNNQIAPQIQQQYIASGQQRSSGLEDQLLRAGVDLNSELDKYAYQFQQDAMNRKQNAIGSILGQGPGFQPGPSTGQNLASAGAGFLASDAVSNMFKSNNAGQSYSYNAPPPNLKGFENDYTNWSLGDPRWGS